MCPALRIVKLHVSWTAIVTPCVVSVTNSDHVHKKCVLTKILTDQKSFDIMFKSLFLCKLAFIVHFFNALCHSATVFGIIYFGSVCNQTYEHAILPFMKTYAFSNQLFRFILFEYTSWFQTNA